MPFYSPVTQSQWIEMVQQFDQGEYEFSDYVREFGVYQVHSMYEDKVSVCSDDGVTVLDALTGEIDPIRTSLLNQLSQVLDDSFELCESRLMLYCPNDALTFSDKKDSYGELKEDNPTLTIHCVGKHSDKMVIPMVYNLF